MQMYDNERSLIENKLVLDKLMLEACMPLQCWISNDPQSSKVYNMNGNMIQNVLGLCWHTHTDLLQVARGDKIPAVFK